MEEGHSQAGANALYRNLLAINYYETIEPQGEEEPPRPLKTVPTQFNSIEVY